MNSDTGHGPAIMYFKEQHIQTGGKQSHDADMEISNVNTLPKPPFDDKMNAFPGADMDATDSYQLELGIIKEMKMNLVKKSMCCVLIVMVAFTVPIFFLGMQGL